MREDLEIVEKKAVDAARDQLRRDHVEQYALPCGVCGIHPHFVAIASVRPELCRRVERGREEPFGNARPIRARALDRADVKVTDDAISATGAQRRDLIDREVVRSGIGIDGEDTKRRRRAREIE